MILLLLTKSAPLWKLIETLVYSGIVFACKSGWLWQCLAMVMCLCLTHYQLERTIIFSPKLQAGPDSKTAKPCKLMEVLGWT